MQMFSYGYAWPDGQPNGRKIGWDGMGWDGMGWGRIGLDRPTASEFGP